MKATNELREEHRAVKQMLEVLDSVCIRLEQDENVDYQHLDAIVDFIRIFTDECHHGKEEDLLFPALEAAGVPNYPGPIGVMLQEHATMRGIIKQLATEIQAYRSGETDAGKRIAEQGRQYITWLRQHIEKEEQILFQIADVHLDEKQQNELFTAFENLEAERIGAGQHEKFHQSLHQLLTIYVSDAENENAKTSDEKALVATKIPPRHRRKF